ncbi:MAG: hypothetical protein ACKOB2_07840 [Solirubrobacterales bacterium]
MVSKVGTGSIARLALIPCLAPLLFFTVTTTASAHQGNPDYESLVGRIEPGVEGVTARVLEGDDALLLETRVERPVTVIGYQGEPMVRFLPGGAVLANLNSPSYWNNFDRFGASDLPERADPAAKPSWKEVSTGGRYAWHDHRIHWMSESIPPSVADESRRTKVFDYEIPLRTPEGAAAIEGTLWWRGDGGPPLALIVIGGAILLALAGGAILLARRRADGPPS